MYYLSTFLKTSYSAYETTSREGDYRGTYTKSQKGSRNPKVNTTSLKTSNYTLDNTLNYNKTINHSSMYRQGSTCTGLLVYIAKSNNRRVPNMDVLRKHLLREGHLDKAELLEIIKEAATILSK